MMAHKAIPEGAAPDIKTARALRYFNDHLCRYSETVCGEGRKT